MKKIIFRFALLFAVVAAQPAISETENLLNETVPNQYTVVEEDTLWDISDLFLRDPWMWPEIWHANHQIANPHLIYPGDFIRLVYIDGQPKLVVSRSRDKKLSPSIPTEDRGGAIAALPLDIVYNFLSKNRVTNAAELQAAPYVLGGYERRLLMGMGDDFYARGDFTRNQLKYGIYRPGDAYIDPISGEVLGIRAEDIASARVKAVDKDIGTLGVTRSEGEIRLRDRLLDREEGALPPVFHLQAPGQEILGQVINIEGGVRNGGALDVVSINRGDRESLKAGDTLAIYKAGEWVKDPVAGQQVRLPDERIGLLMVFYTYEKMSFGLVMEADRQLDIGDLVRNP
jgi:hypothetical protein